MLNFDFILLGAERQSAVSFALCYPEKQFLFVTDQNVIDGWDLSNVQIRYSSVKDLSSLPGNFYGTFLSLSSRYTTAPLDTALKIKNESAFDQLTDIYRSLPEIAIAITKDFTNYPGITFLVKGDHWHKTDASQTVKAENDIVPNNYDGCKLFFQEFLSAEEKFISTGRIVNSKPYFGVIKIHRESIAREEHIIAAETIHDQQIIELTKEVLGKLKYDGLFTINWVKSKGKPFLTSIRPEPRPLVITLKKAGIDLLDPAKSSTEIANAGLKMIGDINYSSYKNLQTC